MPHKQMQQKRPRKVNIELISQNVGTTAGEKFELQLEFAFDLQKKIIFPPNKSKVSGLNPTATNTALIHGTHI